MAVNNPYADNAATVQGPGPTGQEGWPIAVVPATGAVFPVSISGGGKQAVTIADGDDVAEGSTTDAGVTGDTAGTVSAKLRGLNKELAPQPVTGAISGSNLQQAGVVAFLRARDATDGNFYPLAIPDAPAADGVAVTAVGNLLAVWSALRVATAPDSWDGLRTPNVYRTVSAAASGDTAIWTPASGKKFRLMRYMLSVTANAARATAGVITVALRDSTTAINLTHSIFVPGAAATTLGAVDDSNWIDLGNGILSAAANNVLNINLSSGLTAGNFRIIVCGTEE